jgi:hypothetical protein
MLQTKAKNSAELVSLITNWTSCLLVIKLLYRYSPTALLQRGGRRATPKLTEARQLLIRLFLSSYDDTQASRAASEAFLVMALGVCQKTIRSARIAELPILPQALRMLEKLHTAGYVNDQSMIQGLVDGACGEFVRHGELASRRRGSPILSVEPSLAILSKKEQAGQ